ncbi:hizr-1 [Pristionchus pacificus]|uniref:Nhr-33 n=1 Tax=Pristionchus pacificus TaxID=54126 RepID=A0A2A6C7Z3_PRIPA|nr:hizr-1 [Pristionchus pacificus]|eukprot:PDM74332.1 nhr-33 [Pristionchus pacificus]
MEISIKSEPLAPPTPSPPADPHQMKRLRYMVNDVPMDHHLIVESSTTSPPDGQTAICEVCQDLSDGLHFSVYTCRACAAFFRRTVSLKLEYTCRSDGRCPIEKSARNMCRSCRFTKCMNVGMQAGAVQMSRDGIGKRRDGNKQSPGNGNATSVIVRKAIDPNRPSSSEGFYKEYSPVSGVAGITLQQAFLPMRHEQMRILPKMQEGYNHFLSIRKATHSLVENDSLTQMFQKNELSLRPSHFESSKKVCQMEAHLVTDIVNSYFYPFCELPFTDKVLMFKNFFCYLSQTDRAFQSYKNFGSNPNDDRLIMPDGGYIKLSDLESFYANAESVKASPTDAANIFRPAMQYILDVIIGHMRRIRLSDTEYICILGLFLWSEGVAGITPETLTMIHDTQAALFADLHIYYRSLGLEGSQITTKTGLLMMLMPKLTRSVVMMRENFELAELFNVFEADVCCKSFKNSSVD